MRIKDKLYKVAADLFEQKGYPATSIRDIAHEMNLKPSSLYSHIKSKEEILISICHLVADAYESGLSKIMEEIEDPKQRLQAVIDLHVDMACTDAVSITVFNNEWKHLPEPELRLFTHRRRRYEKRLMDIIRPLSQKSNLPSGASYFFLQSILSSMLWLHRTEVKKIGISQSQIKELMKTFILSGILKD